MRVEEGHLLLREEDVGEGFLVFHPYVALFQCVDRTYRSAVIAVVVVVVVVAVE